MAGSNENRLQQTSQNLSTQTQKSRHWTVLFAVSQWLILLIIFVIQAWAFGYGGAEILFGISILFAFLSMVISVKIYDLDKSAIPLSVFLLIIWSVYNLFFNIPYILAAIYLGVVTAVASEHFNQNKDGTTNSIISETSNEKNSDRGCFKNTPTYDRLVDRGMARLPFPTLFSNHRGNVEKDTSNNIVELGQASIEIINSIYTQDCTAEPKNIDYMLTLISRAGYAVTPELEQRAAEIKKRTIERKRKSR